MDWYPSMGAPLCLFLSSTNKSLAGFKIALSVPEAGKMCFLIKLLTIVKLAGSGRCALSNSPEPRGWDRMVVSPSSGGADAGRQRPKSVLAKTYYSSEVEAWRSGVTD